MQVDPAERRTDQVMRRGLESVNPVWPFTALWSILIVLPAELPDPRVDGRAVLFELAAGLAVEITRPPHATYGTNATPSPRCGASPGG